MTSQLVGQARAARLAEALQAELGRDSATRETGAGDDSLRAAIEIVEDLNRSLETGRWRLDQTYPRLTHLVNDSWSLTSALANELSDLESLCRELASAGLRAMLDPRNDSGSAPP